MSIAASLALTGAAVATILLLTRPAGTPPTSTCTAVRGPASTPVTLTPEQAQNASIIAAVALKMGLPDHAVTIALATAMQESRLRDLDYGDRDSLGLFQQRPSQGWGTPAQILDPEYATSAFYGRLVQVPGWETMAVTDAAQAVQQSGSPAAYAQWEEQARTVAIALTGEQPGAFTCRLAGFAGAAPPPAALPAAASQELGPSRLGVPLEPRVGWVVAYWVVAHAWQYHVRQVAFAGWIWTESTGRWTHPSLVAGPAAVTYG